MKSPRTLSFQTAAVLLAAFAAASLLGACGAGAYTISDESFSATDVCDGTGTYELSMAGGQVQVTAIGDVQTQMLAGGMPSVWCGGLTHQYTGSVLAFGYTFDSDPSDPLTFAVDRENGYQYVSGTGTVTDPDGQVTSLP